MNYTKVIPCCAEHPPSTRAAYSRRTCGTSFLCKNMMLGIWLTAAASLVLLSHPSVLDCQTMSAFAKQIRETGQRRAFPPHLTHSGCTNIINTLLEDGASWRITLRVKQGLTQHKAVSRKNLRKSDSVSFHSVGCFNSSQDVTFFIFIFLQSNTNCATCNYYRIKTTGEY